MCTQWISVVVIVVVPGGALAVDPMLYFALAGALRLAVWGTKTLADLTKRAPTHRDR